MTRDEYIAKLKAQLDEWNAQLEQLETKGQNAKAEAQSEYEDQLAALRHRRDEAYQKLDELTQASGDAWEDLQQGCDKAFTALKEGVERAWAHFR